MYEAYIGLDLSASPKRKSAYAVLSEDLRCRAALFRGDEELLSVARNYRHALVAIDAPLSLPVSGSLRGCEKALTRLGIRAFPPALPGMRQLAERAISLSEKLREQGLRVVEVYPGGAQDVLGLPRKKNPEGLLKGLLSLGMVLEAQTINGDILDAATAAYTAWSYAHGKYIMIRTGDCELILPAP
ncbi:MAG: DUF429 domain-containing protein [Thermofilum sp.]